MDTAYDVLRKQAAEKRDKIIAAAKDEYRVTMRRIRALHQMVEGKPHPPIRPPRRSRDRRIPSLLADVLPIDKAFTVADACELLYDHPLALNYKEATVRAQFPVMAGLGLIRKVGRRRGHVLWARPESGIEPAPLQTLSLCEIAEQLIREHGPLRVTEIALKMKQRGYRPQESHTLTYNMLRRSMTRISGRFVQDDSGRWKIA